MPMRTPLLLSLALLLSACGQEQAPPPTAATPAEPAAPAAGDAPAPLQTSAEINTADFGAQIERLADDRLEGRGPGSKGEKLTVEYLISEFQRIGLQPGNGDSWTQDVPMIEIRGEVTEPLTLRVGDTEMVLDAGTQSVVGSRLTQPEVSVADSEIVFAGYGVVAPEYDWNDYAGLDAKGKTVVVLVNDPGFGIGDESLFKGKAMTYYGRWSYKFEECARQGAAACIIVHETEGASYPWEVVRNSWSGPEFDLPRGEGADPVVTVQGWITRDKAVELFAAAGKDFDAIRPTADARGFAPFSLGGTASVKLRNEVREASSPNVLGLLKGSQRPDELIIYTAHWDHLGRTFGDPNDNIYNGAIDNATGVAGLLEIAEAFAKADAPPARSVLFLAVTLEESGLLGSRWYAQNPVYPLTRTAANINMDALPIIGPTNDVVVVGYGSSELENVLRDAATAQNRQVVQEPTPQNGFYYRSDHFNFAKVGVPALYAKGGIDHREKGADYGRQMAVDYTTNRYHKPADEYDASWDLRGAVEDLQLLYEVGRRVADSDGWPQWLEGSEFKARRDADMAAAQ
ncbi:MAG: M28 family peptidase [Xanthomonadales bacterium]|nr:M28 family peptidase [Xanthomonadales bacterium]